MARVAALVREAFGAYTQTIAQPPVVRGYWLYQGELYIDELALLFVDLQASEFPREVLEETLDTLRTGALAAYRDLGSEQLELWISVEAIELYLG